MNVKEKLRNLKIFRVIVQIIFFILMPSLFSQAFAGVKEAVALIGKGENIILSDFAIKLLILCTATIVFGRIFCGFVCSFGAVGDWFYMLSEFISASFSAADDSRRDVEKQIGICADGCSEVQCGRHSRTGYVGFYGLAGTNRCRCSW